MALALGGEVERACVVAAPADHRAHLTRRVFDRHERGGRASRVGEVAVDRVFGRALQFEVERRLDPQAPVERARRAVAFDHLLLHPAREVAGVNSFDRRLLGRLDVHCGGQRLLDALFVDHPSQVALFEHLPQNDVAARPCRHRMVGGVIRGGGLDDAGQQRRLPRLQLFDAELMVGRAAAEVVDVMTEVGLRGGLDPVGAVAEVDRVQVRRDDLFLRPLV